MNFEVQNFFVVLKTFLLLPPKEKSNQENGRWSQLY